MRLIYLSLVAFAFLLFINEGICDELSYSNIKLNLLISKVPYFCQIKLSTFQLESHNLQESLIPFEKLTPKYFPNVFDYNERYPKVFKFFPSPFIRSNCRVNFLYSTIFNHKTYKFTYDDRNGTISYLHYVTNYVYDNRSWYRNWLRFKSYNVILTSNLKPSAAYAGWELSLGLPLTFMNKHHYAILAILGFSNKSKPMLCTISTIKNYINYQRGCKIYRNLYSDIFIPNGQDISSWELSMDIVFTVQTEYQEEYRVLPGGPWHVRNSMNPFKSKRVDQTMAEILVQKSNGTLVVETIKSILTKSVVGRIVIEKESTGKREWAMVDSIRTQFDFVKLFTCYEQPKLSFVMYVSPFDPEIWVSIFCAGTTTCILFHLIQRVINLSSADKSFSYLLFVVGALIEEAYIFPPKLQRFLTFKVLFFPWAICSFLLSTCYNSLLVANINSPLTSQSINSTDQIFCPLPENLRKTGQTESASFMLKLWQNVSRQIYGSRLSKFQHYVRGLEIQRYYSNLESARACFAILMMPQTNTEIGNFGQNWLQPNENFNLLMKFAAGYFDFKISQLSYNSSAVRKKFNQLLKFYSPLNRHFYLLDDINLANACSTEFLSYLNSSGNTNLGETALEWDILNTPKIAVIGPESRLTDEIAYLKLQHRHLKNCHVIHEPLYNTSSYWHFQEKSTTLFDTFRLLFESGIYLTLLKNEDYRKQLKRLIGTNLILQNMNKTSFDVAVQAVKLSGSIQTVFFLWVALLCLAVLILIAEAYHRFFAVNY